MEETDVLRCLPLVEADDPTEDMDTRRSIGGGCETKAGPTEELWMTSTAMGSFAVSFAVDTDFLGESVAVVVGVMTALTSSATAVVVVVLVVVVVVEGVLLLSVTATGSVVFDRAETRIRLNCPIRVGPPNTLC